MKELIKHRIFILLSVLITSNNCLSQNIKLSFDCLDKNQTTILLNIPSCYSSILDSKDSGYFIQVKNNYLFEHDSCFAIIAENSTFLPLYFISSEELDKSKTPFPIDAVQYLLEFSKSNNKYLVNASIKKQFLFNYSTEAVLLKYQDINNESYNLINIFFINNRIITIASMGLDEKDIKLAEDLLADIIIVD